MGQDPFETAKERRNDVFDEFENNILTLRFFNALDASPIRGATVTIKNVGEFTTDIEGKVQFDPPEDGTYPFLFEHPKFIETVGRFEVLLGGLFFNRFSMSPKMDIDNLRIVVDWDSKPEDLDANFQKIGSYHISYRNKAVADDGSAQLDRDDTNGNGPETITVKKTLTQDQYLYYVEDFTNKSNRTSRQLSRSKATVRVYGQNRLLETIEVPRKARGNKWTVFQIVNGQIQILNTVE